MLGCVVKEKTIFPALHGRVFDRVNQSAPWPPDRNALGAADVDFEGLANRALDQTVFKAATPAQDKRAPFVGISHLTFLLRDGHY